MSILEFNNKISEEFKRKAKYIHGVFGGQLEAQQKQQKELLKQLSTINEMEDKEDRDTLFTGTINELTEVSDDMSVATLEFFSKLLTVADELGDVAAKRHVNMHLKNYVDATTKSGIQFNEKTESLISKIKNRDFTTVD